MNYYPLKTLISCLLALFFTSANAQQVTGARPIIDTLTSPAFWGRGYTNNGMEKAAQYLSAQFSKLGLQPLKGSSFLQPFSYAVNTFPGEMQLAVNGTEMLPGIDFIVGEESRGAKGEMMLEHQDSTHFLNVEKRVMIDLQDKLTWSVSNVAADYTSIHIDKSKVDGVPHTISLNIEHKLVGTFKANNVCGYVKGTEEPDSFVVITAHYDHLGGMGCCTYFPGANDNASGIAMVLELAKYYAQHPPAYSVAFLFFAGEEAGLLGSKHFTNHPLVPMKKVRFLTNLDLVGTGNEGITVVNATEFRKEFDDLNRLNKAGHFLNAINARGKAANSDHYWFTESGVPSFFIYTLGGIKAYHDVFDKSATLPLTEYEDLFKLIVQFKETVMK